jgi:hypothetical protein
MRKLYFVFVSLSVFALLGLGIQSAHAWCDPRDITCGAVIDSNNSHGHTDINRYSCTGTLNLNGKADVYRVNHPGGLLSITLTWSGTETTALYVFLLGSCNQNDCIGADEHLVQQNLPAGHYWIIVDGRSSSHSHDYVLGIFCGDHPFPVELTSFDAVAEAGTVLVRWQTASEKDVAYYEVSRSEDDANWQTVAHVNSFGNNAAGFSYSYRDDHVAAGKSYSYRLTSHDLDGALFTSPQVASVTLSGSAQPTSFNLEQNYPNPFNPSTTIKFDVAEASHVRLAVFDLSGRMVANLVDRELSADAYSYTFDATNLPSGMYFYRLETGSFSSTKKLVLMK